MLREEFPLPIVKTAIILAAGMGTRLKELGQSFPKGFLQLGERTIINVILLSGQTNAGDEVYVATSGETIVAMSKNQAELSNQIAGELVGISKISQPLFERMLQHASLRFENSLKVDYEVDGLVSAAQSYPVYYTAISDLLWAEIDDLDHLVRAKEQIYPAIVQKDN